MPTDDKAEAQFLALAERFKELQVPCPCHRPKYGYIGQPLDICDRCWHGEDAQCLTCQGRTWNPLPVEQRVGALMEVCRQRRDIVTFYPYTGDVLIHGFKSFSAPKFWQALTAALTQALGPVIATEKGLAALDAGDFVTLAQLDEQVTHHDA